MRMKINAPRPTDATKREDLQQFANRVQSRWFRLPFSDHPMIASNRILSIEDPTLLTRRHGLLDVAHADAATRKTRKLNSAFLCGERIGVKHHDPSAAREIASTLLLRRRSPLSVLVLMTLSVPLLAGCDSRGWGQSGVDGYWKGQIVGVAVGENEPISNAHEKERPRRILMKLEEKAGAVHGKFALSSDAIAFRQLDNGSSRSVTTHTVDGAREGAQVRMRFTSDEGFIFLVDAMVSANRIWGTYSVAYGTASPLAGTTERGKLEVERY